MDINQKLIAFIKEEDGQTTTEYVLIMAVIVTVFMNFRRKLLGIFGSLFKQLDRATDNVICDPIAGDC